MKQNRNIIIGMVVLVIIAIGTALAVSGSKQSSTTAPATSAPKSSASSTDNTNATTSNATATNKVEIKEYMFNPMAITVKVGDTVTWTNQDGVKHNVVADNSSADAPNGPLIAKGETYSFTFKKAGTYSFHCMPHPYMHGTVVVTQ